MKQSVKTAVRLTVIAAAVASLSACGGGGGGGGGDGGFGTPGYRADTTNVVGKMFNANGLNNDVGDYVLNEVPLDGQSNQRNGHPTTLQLLRIANPSPQDIRDAVDALITRANWVSTATQYAPPTNALISFVNDIATVKIQNSAGVVVGTYYVSRDGQVNLNSNSESILAVKGSVAELEFNNSLAVGDRTQAKTLNRYFGVDNISIGTPDTNRSHTAAAWQHSDVQAAYNSGWTGKGIDIQVIDDFGGPGALTAANGYVTSAQTTHGAKVAEIAAATARGSNVFGADTMAPEVGTNGQKLDGANYLGSRNTGSEGQTDADWRKVVNMSFGFTANNWAANISVKDWNDNGTSYTNRNSTVSAEWTTFLAQNTGARSSTDTVGNSNVPVSYLFVKAAGNGGVFANMSDEPLNVAMKNMPNVLFVGNKDAQPQHRSVVNAEFQGKTLVVSAPYTNAAGVIGTTGTETGSSYAAPVVAGYAAIVMHKFNNMNGVQTADILLKTARKDTFMVGNVNTYDPAKHGQGEASLSRALSPIGRLR